MQRNHSSAVRSWVLALLGGLVAYGCSGASQSELFSSEGEADGAGAIDADGPDTNVTDGSSTPDTTPPKKDGSTPVDSGGKDVVVAVDTGVSMDAGPDVAPDAPPPPAIECGGVACLLGAEECCQGNQSSSCVKTSAFCPLKEPLRIPCDETSDCAGAPNNVCCLTVTKTGGGGTRPVDVTCRPKVDCRSFGGATQRFEVCNPKAPVCQTGACGVSAATFEGYGICL